MTGIELIQAVLELTKLEVDLKTDVKVTSAKANWYTGVESVSIDIWGNIVITQTMPEMPGA